MNLFGKEYRRREVEAALPRIEPLAGVRRIQLTEGPDAGVDMIQVCTGAGLAYEVNASRCLDIALAQFAGVPFSWTSPAGNVHPAPFDPNGREWLRTAAGGLLMTCGFTTAGAPSEDQGEKLGLHGRAHHIAARHVSAEAAWHGDDYLMRVAGIIEQTALFAESIRLTREIRSRMGDNSIFIRDVVENVAFKPTPFMLLYHFNFGFPFLSEHTTFEYPSRRVTPREKNLAMSDFDRYQSPEQGYEERVYYHDDLKTDANNWTDVVLRNPRFPMPGVKGGAPVTVHVRWAVENLPLFTEWKMPGSGVYAFGVEPSNCHVEGRAAERKRGTLMSLAPGESSVFELEIRVNAE